MKLRSRVLPLCATVLACNGDVDIGGRYDLVSVEGETLPYAMTHGASRLMMFSGYIEIEAGRAVYGNETGYIENGDTLFSTYVGEGTADREGSRIVVRPDDAPPEVCTVTPILRIENEGDRLRIIDSLATGACPEGEDAIITLEMVFERD